MTSAGMLHWAVQVRALKLSGALPNRFLRSLAAPGSLHHKERLDFSTFCRKSQRKEGKAPVGSLTSATSRGTMPAHRSLACPGAQQQCQRGPTSRGEDHKTQPPWEAGTMRNTGRNTAVTRQAGSLPTARKGSPGREAAPQSTPQLCTEPALGIGTAEVGLAWGRGHGCFCSHCWGGPDSWGCLAALS